MLTGQAKKDYQRDYMRRRRAGLTREPALDLSPIVRPKTCVEAEQMGRERMPGGIIPEIVLDPVRPELDPVQPDDIEIEEEDKPKVPLYNPQIHRAGDIVRMTKGKREVIVTIPEFDADGYAVYDD